MAYAKDPFQVFKVESHEKNGYKLIHSLQRSRLVEPIYKMSRQPFLGKCPFFCLVSGSK